MCEKQMNHELMLRMVALSITLAYRLTMKTETRLKEWFYQSSLLNYYVPEIFDHYALTSEMVDKQYLKVTPRIRE